MNISFASMRLHFINHQRTSTIYEYFFKWFILEDMSKICIRQNHKSLFCFFPHCSGLEALGKASSSWQWHSSLVLREVKVGLETVTASRGCPKISWEIHAAFSLKDGNSDPIERWCSPLLRFQLNKQLSTSVLNWLWIYVHVPFARNYRRDELDKLSSKPKKFGHRGGERDSIEFRR